MVDSWTSEKEPHKITGLVVGKTYQLVETLPADGYVTAETIEFTIADTSEVQPIEMKDDITKLKKIVRGGATGQESIENVLAEIAKDCKDDDIVLVHDGARPYLPAQVITDNIETCRKHGNGITAIDCKEAMLVTPDKIHSDVSIDRETLYRTQTPHSMYLKDMLDLHEEAKARGITGSVATCTLLIECGHTVWFNRGSDLNFKITSREDLLIFKALLAEQDSKNWLR